LLQLQKPLKEAVWFQQLLSELGVGGRSTTLYCDNQSAIALVNNPTFHQRTKHINVRLFDIRELQEKKTVNIVYISTEQQLADILTKPLAAPSCQWLWMPRKITRYPRNCPNQNLEHNI
jgi:hypothetical protein